MASITHFSHEHSLILLKQLPAEETKPVCRGCQQPLIHEGKHDIDVYGCEVCASFFLHKSCAQLPMEIVHESHQHHSLFLLPKPPFKYSEACCCDLCFKSLFHSFFYYCFLDDFYLDTKCAFKENESIISSNNDLLLYHPSHKDHPLTIQPRPSSFLCDACDVKNEDLSYQCTSCHYWIHRRCAMLPSTTNHDVHNHTLSLSFGLPSQYWNFIYYCGICKESLSRLRLHWLYHCHLCRYFFHIKCMETKIPEIEIDLKGLRIDDLLHLPGVDRSVELIQRFLLKDNSLDTVKQEISVFSHKHPLIYSNEHIIEDEIEDGEQVLCDACIEPIISPPYYHCPDCRYYLHLSCSELPRELQHPIHPHLLILSSTARFDIQFQCNRCYRYFNGLCFYCTDKYCNFILDVKCAALPDIVKHECHKHPLFPLKFNPLVWCICCGLLIRKTHFGCEPCKFYIHHECLMLPKTMKHRFDSKFPLTLRYPPHFYHPRPLDCAECENEINPNCWLYHCEESDLSFHVYCIKRWWVNNDMKFGQKLRISSHRHPLKYVYQASVRSPCNCCQNPDTYFYFECEICNFHLCVDCVQKIEPPS